MKYFQEITLLRDARIGLYDFWQKAFQQTHIALADNKNDDGTSAIGVSFPEYDAAEYSLGTKLRLFAEDEASLEKLQIEKWLRRLRDYVQVGSILPVPEQVKGHACFRQVKPKGSREKLARRRSKRTGESIEQALSHFSGYQEERSRLPYIHMRSETNGHRFRLFIEKVCMTEPRRGAFSCYGLGGRSPDKLATVPCF